MIKGVLAHPEGFEPPTPKFVVWCSIGQISLDHSMLKCSQIAH